MCTNKTPHVHAHVVSTSVTNKGKHNMPMTFRAHHIHYPNIYTTTVRSKGEERLDIAENHARWPVKAQHCDSSWRASSEISIKSIKQNMPTVNR